MDRLLLATRNRHKAREFVEILGNEFQIRDLSDLRIEPVEETGQTFAENAILKAIAVSRESDSLVIADDSGLEVHALGGAPGIFSARYAGQGTSDSKNIEKLRDELANCCHEQRSARFRCVIALARGGELLKTFEGVVEGIIVDQPRGQKGFGYDPVFQPNGFEETFGELDPVVKNRISHRAKAIATLREFLRTH